MPEQNQAQAFKQKIEAGLAELKPAASHRSKPDLLHQPTSVSQTHFLQVYCQLQICFHRLHPTVNNISAKQLFKKIQSVDFKCCLITEADIVLRLIDFCLLPTRMTPSCRCFET